MGDRIGRLSDALVLASIDIDVLVRTVRNHNGSVPRLHIKERLHLLDRTANTQSSSAVAGKVKSYDAPPAVDVRHDRRPGTEVRPAIDRPEPGLPVCPQRAAARREERDPDACEPGLGVSHGVGQQSPPESTNAW